MFGFNKPPAKQEASDDEARKALSDRLDEMAETNKDRPMRDIEQYEIPKSTLNASDIPDLDKFYSVVKEEPESEGVHMNSGDQKNFDNWHIKYHKQVEKMSLMDKEREMNSLSKSDLGRYLSMKSMGTKPSDNIENAA